MICGIMTDFCINATVEAGFEHGLHMIVPAYANSTQDNEYMTREQAYHYYNEFLWPERYADCIPMDRALELLKKWYSVNGLCWIPLLPKYIWYERIGDYYIPVLTLSSEEQCPIEKYGRMHREYLREVHPARLNTLTLTGELWTYLADLNEQAQERLDIIMEQMKTAEGVTEELKCTRQMEWVRRCNNIHNRAEEIVLHEIIYS